MDPIWCDAAIRHGFQFAFLFLSRSSSCPQYRRRTGWSRQAYPSLYYFHEVAKGGHFAAWEQPELFSAEMREAFRSLR
jgi:pimeloyl-ACP methyl ester carboxylesterase